MIEILGYHVEPQETEIAVVWDLHGVAQPMLCLQGIELMELLLDTGLIADYHHECEVAIVVNGQKHWLGFSYFLQQEITDTLVQTIVEKASVMRGHL